MPQNPPKNSLNFAPGTPVSGDTVYGWHGGAPRQFQTNDLKGATGPTGATGPAGATGPTGPTGPTGGGPFPFFGTRGTTVPWSRPSLSTFSTWLNRGNEAVLTGSDAPFYDDSTPIAPGTGYTAADTVTIAGGTGASPATVITVDDVDGGGGIVDCHISTFGTYTTPPTNPAAQATSSGPGTGATFGFRYATNAVAVDNPGGLPLVISYDSSIPPAGGGGGPACALSGLLKNIGSPPWTITVASAALANFNTAGGVAGPPWVPIILCNSAGDKAVALWWDFYTFAAVYVYHYDGTFNGTLTKVSASSGPGFPFPDYFAWFRVVNDGSNLTFSISAEGVVFLPFYTEAANALVASFDKVGFGFDRSKMAVSATNQVAAALWNWVES